MLPFILANQMANEDSGQTKTDKIAAIVEAVLVTFFITLIPKLIELKTIPTKIEDIYVSLLSSVLMAFYTYIRIRGLEANKK